MNRSGLTRIFAVAAVAMAAGFSCVTVIVEDDDDPIVIIESDDQDECKQDAGAMPDLSQDSAAVSCAPLPLPTSTADIACQWIDPAMCDGGVAP